jgi:hypothetical protein
MGPAIPDNIFSLLILTVTLSNLIQKTQCRSCTNSTFATKTLNQLHQHHIEKTSKTSFLRSVCQTGWICILNGNSISFWCCIHITSKGTVKS